jgi:hypothetical protein
MKWLSVLALPCAALFVACAGVTEAELRADLSKQTSFIVDGDYQDIARKILPVMRECWTVSGGSLVSRVHMDQFPDTKSITISAMYSVNATNGTTAIIDIKDAGNKATSIAASFSGVPIDKAKSNILGWISGSSKECR